MLLLRTHHEIKIAGPKYKDRLSVYYNGWAIHTLSQNYL